MVLGILTAIAACPAIIGTTEAVRQGQRQNAREKHRGLKTNLAVACSRATKAGREIDGCEVVLSENKVREPEGSIERYSTFSDADKVTSYISTCHQRSSQTAIRRTILSQVTSYPILITIGDDRVRAWYLRFQMTRHS
jgi:GTPase